MSACWNSVTVYGPAPELERFKRLCLAPAESIYTHGQFGWDGCECTISVPAVAAVVEGRSANEYAEYVSNFQQFFGNRETEYSFSFDTPHWFPEPLFELLAERFPALAFDCDCIDSIDDFMGYGWFNPPAGGEAFSQNYTVPENYWTGGGGLKRTEAAQQAHNARTDELLEHLATG